MLCLMKTLLSFALCTPNQAPFPLWATVHPTKLHSIRTQSLLFQGPGKKMWGSVFQGPKWCHTKYQWMVRVTSLTMCTCTKYNILLTYVYVLYILIQNILIYKYCIFQSNFSGFFLAFFISVFVTNISGSKKHGSNYPQLIYSM